MGAFEQLVQSDKQLQFARRAVAKYQRQLDHGPDDSEAPLDSEGLGAAAAQLNKRHIMNVDDISKINYEVVKSVPGNLLTPLYAGTHKLEGRQLDDERLENEVVQAKTKLYKNHLYTMNDEFLAALRAPAASTKAKRAREVADEESDEDLADVPLQVQIQWLQEIQHDLMGTYKDLVNKEKKWFTLKEVILDANAELDLFSTKDVERAPPNVNLGDPNAPTNPYSTVNTMLFHSKKKRNKKILP
ncbi:hypothetical protein TPHA_0P00290 [Tetrapisispora phaffii CBS 4417]|uniref:Uncharacterized protein n=1 Tax=Tetrapisispora phaffii (strain ATCC 24235 / CBS 4417 / NBRC 1672 / NRRL Y-8282 / UCD 70-5) TaxID=1071381 RepID=G8C209_TETPH|nr:hypothetical protein TPHA_0P00290 [Tetrapisispora phaffii CBS 4417]CCE66187.1 hypothetical protein TPHA_0P00290 [Tetrapisispora phaffii CBS 4417]